MCVLCKTRLATVDNVGLAERRSATQSKMPKRPRTHDALLWIAQHEAERARLIAADACTARLVERLRERMAERHRPLLLVVNELGSVTTICKGSVVRTLEEFDARGFTVEDLHPLSFQL